MKTLEKSGSRAYAYLRNPPYQNTARNRTLLVANPHKHCQFGHWPTRHGAPRFLFAQRARGRDAEARLAGRFLYRVDPLTGRPLMPGSYTRQDGRKQILQCYIWNIRSKHGIGLLFLFMTAVDFFLITMLDYKEIVERKEELPAKARKRNNFSQIGYPF